MTFVKIIQTKPITRQKSNRNLNVQMISHPKRQKITIETNETIQIKTNLPISPNDSNNADVIGIYDRIIAKIAPKTAPLRERAIQAEIS